MKKNLFIVGLTLAFAFAAASGFAQESNDATVAHHTPKWVSTMGYWVAESNINTPKHNTLYFYNNDDVLVYKETMDGVVLKLNKRRIKTRLKKLVDQTVTAFAQKQTVAVNEMLVAKLIK